MEDWGKSSCRVAPEMVNGSFQGEVYFYEVRCISTCSLFLPPKTPK